MVVLGSDGAFVQGKMSMICGAGSECLASVAKPHGTPVFTSTFERHVSAVLTVLYCIVSTVRGNSKVPG